MRETLRTLLAKLALFPTKFSVVAPDWVTPSSCSAREDPPVAVMVLDVPLPVIVMLEPAVSVSILAAMAVLYAEASTKLASSAVTAAVVA